MYNLNNLRGLLPVATYQILKTYQQWENISQIRYVKRKEEKAFTRPTSAERKAVYPVSWSLQRATFSLACATVLYDVIMDGWRVSRSRSLLRFGGCVKPWFVTHVWTDSGNRCAEISNHQSITLTTSIPNKYIRLYLTLGTMLFWPKFAIHPSSEPKYFALNITLWLSMRIQFDLPEDGKITNEIFSISQLFVQDNNDMKWWTNGSRLLLLTLSPEK